MVRDAGLIVSLFQPFRDFEGMPEPQRAKAFDRAEHKFDLMQALGTDLILVCSNVSPLALGGIDRAAEDLHELGRRAAKRGLRIGYEALAWGRFVSDHRDAWEIVRRADHASVGLVLDSFHTLARGIAVDSIRAIPKEKLFLVQLADAPKLELDFVSWSRHFRCMPGQGDLPILDFARSVQATGYDGFWSLEIFNDQFRAGSARSVAADGMRSLIFLADRMGGDGSGALPPRARLRTASSSSSSRSMTRRRMISKGFSAASAFASAANTSRKTWPSGARATSISSSIASARFRPFVLCDARSRGLRDRAARR